MIFENCFRGLKVIELREAVCFLSVKNLNSHSFKPITLDEHIHILNTTPEHSDNETEKRWHREFLYRRINTKGKPDALSYEELELCNFITEYVSSCLTSLLLDRNPIDAIYSLSFPLIRTNIDTGKYSQSYKSIKIHTHLENRIYLFDSYWLGMELMFLNLLSSSNFIHPFREQSHNFINYKSDTRKKRDLIIKILAHYLFSSENHVLKWNQKKVVEHDLMRAFGVTADFSPRGDFRVMKDLIRELIPEQYRKVGNPKYVHYTDDEISTKPNPISGIFHIDVNGKKKVDLLALRIAGRTISLAYLLHKKERKYRGYDYLL